MGTAGIWFHGPKGRTSNQHFSKINGFFEATEPKEEGLSDAHASVALAHLLHLLTCLLMFTTNVQCLAGRGILHIKSTTKKE